MGKRELVLKYDEAKVKCPNCGGRLRGLAVKHFTATIYPVERDGVMEIDFVEADHIEEYLNGLDCIHCGKTIDFTPYVDVLLVPVED